MKNCLMVVDLQNGFVNQHSRRVVRRIEELLKKECFDLVVASRFCNHEDSPFVRLMHWRRMMGDKEQAFASSQLEQRADLILKKDLYSCMTLDFLNWIESNEVSKIYFAGVDTDGCVLKSAFDCFDLGQDFVIIEDCCASSGGEKIHEMALNIMRRSFGMDRLCRAEDLK